MIFSQDVKTKTTRHLSRILSAGKELEVSAGKDFEVEESKSNLEAFVEFTESKDDKLILVMAEILHQLGLKKSQGSQGLWNWIYPIMYRILYIYIPGG